MNSIFGIVVACLASAFLVTCGPNNRASLSDFDGEVPEVSTVSLVIYGSIGNPFWSKVIAGAEEAAAALDIDVNVQFASSDPVQMNNIIDTVIAARTDGLGLVIDQDGAYDGAIAKALQKKIPVVSFNIDDGRGRESGRQAFIGQEFSEAGYLLGQHITTVADIGDGDRAVCPVEHPEATYAQERHRGVERAFNELGATCEMISTGSIGLEDTLTKLTQYLIGNPDTKAVVSLGSLPTEVAPKAIEDARVTIPNGGFDLSPTILKNIISGKTLSVVDQQPFYQGYFSVTQLYYAKRYGLQPVDINTGAALIDMSNAQSALRLSETVR